ncbi:MAG: ribosome maturation factor RimP [Acidimicrobiales bacterium]
MSDELSNTLSPLLAELDLSLVDAEITAGRVKVTVDRPGGVDLDSIAAAHKVVSAALDVMDPIPGRYTLEVSSPGVERRLRTPEHFAQAVGEVVSVRTVPGAEPRRVQGRLQAADVDGFVVESTDPPGQRHYLRFVDVERARTVFDWAPAPPPGRRSRQPTGATPRIATTERVGTP